MPSGLNEPPRLDRRNHVRIAPKGTLVVTGEHTIRGRITNLGSGGVYATTTVATPESMLSRTVSVELRLDGQEAAWISIAGHVARIDAHGVAIVFDAPPPPLLAMIDAMSMAARANGRVMSAVLIDTNAERSDAIAEGFRTVGCNVIQVTTPLEAIVRLGESQFEPDVIIVADSASSSAEDLRQFVERDHPRARLIAIGDTALAPSGNALWLSSMDPSADLAARVLDLLGRPRR